MIVTFDLFEIVSVLDPAKVMAFSQPAGAGGSVEALQD